MARAILASGLGTLVIPGYQIVPHIQDLERAFMDLVWGRYRRLLVSIPIRHGKSEYSNLFIATLLISRPETRCLRVMATSTTAEEKAMSVLKYVDHWGPKLTGVKLDRRKHSLGDFRTEAGGGLRSVGKEGDVEGWGFDYIFIDDLLVDPYEIRSPVRREQVYKDLQTKFFSRVNPMGSTRFVFIGSRRHPDDPQGRLLEADAAIKDPRDRWHYHHRPAILNEGTDHEEALWPTSQEFDLAGLRAERDKKIADGVLWEWSSLFQNDPTAAPDMLAFDPAWFNPPEKLFYDCPPEALPAIKHRVMAFDPSMGDGSALNDYFAVVWLLFTATGDIFVDDSFIQQAGPDAATAASVSMVKRHQDADVVAFEANAGGKYIAKLISDECVRQGLLFPVVFKQWSGGKSDLDMGDKMGRISLALWEKLSRGKIHLRDTPHNRVLFRQLRGFPTEHDDGPDAVSTGDLVLRELLLKKGRK